MWKQWINTVLGLLVVIFAFSGISALWTAGAGLIVLVLSFWAGIEGVSYEGSSVSHVH